MKTYHSLVNFREVWSCWWKIKKLCLEKLLTLHSKMEPQLTRHAVFNEGHCIPLLFWTSFCQGWLFGWFFRKCVWLGGDQSQLCKELCALWEMSTQGLYHQQYSWKNCRSSTTQHQYWICAHRRSPGKKSHGTKSRFPLWHHWFWRDTNDPGSRRNFYGNLQEMGIGSGPNWSMNNQPFDGK